MVRIHIVTEGTTEKNFVDDVLKDYLAAKGIFTDAHSVTTRRDRRQNRVYRGGMDNINHLLKDIRLWLSESQHQPDCWITTMVDLYAFPYTGKPEWINEFESLNTGLEKVKYLQDKLAVEFAEFRHFIPYIQLHEFEALLLVNTHSIHDAFHGSDKLSILHSLNNAIEGLSPENINQGQHSAPSKRIIQYYPEYEDNKAVWGSLIAREIGIDAMRAKCPHFNDWITTLENIQSTILHAE